MKKWMDIDEFFNNYNANHDKKYPMPKNECLKKGKRKDLFPPKTETEKTEK